MSGYISLHCQHTLVVEYQCNSTMKWKVIASTKIEILHLFPAHFWIFTGCKFGRSQP